MRRREFSTLLGGAATASTVWPFAARAQQKAVPVIGFLGGSTPRQAAALVAGFHQGLNETGYVEGQNVVIDYRWPEGSYDRLPAMAADLVGRRVDVIVAGGPPAAHAAKNATSTIPIVFVTSRDPVEEGFVARLRKGEIPIFEPDLERLVAANSREGRLDFATDLRGPVARQELHLRCRRLLACLGDLLQQRRASDDRFRRCSRSAAGWW